MTSAAPRLLLRPLRLCCLLLGLAYSATVAAQVQEPVGSPSPSPCSPGLELAEQRYVEADYSAAELLALNCAYHPEAYSVQRQQAYRLLALSSIKQGLLVEAQQAVIRLLGVDFGYEPDVVRDPPAYVALVASVKDQLRVVAPEGQEQEQVPAPARLDEPGTAAVVVNMNAATAAELDAVPGIGPVLAARIIEYREAIGPFRSVQDLQEVSGIGPRSIERMAPYLTTEESTRLVVEAGGGSAPPLTVEESPDPVSSFDQALVNLNTASAIELEALDGIGLALAARIIEYREAHGPFRRVEDIAAVRGIGPRTLERFANRATVD